VILIPIRPSGPTAGRIGRDCAQRGYHPALYTSALGVTLRTSDPNINGLTVTSAVFPWMENSTPAEQQYQAALHQYAPQITRATAEAWTSGMMLAAAVQALGAQAIHGPLTSPLIAQGRGKLHHNTLGGLSPGVTFVQVSRLPNKPALGWLKSATGNGPRPRGTRSPAASHAVYFGISSTYLLPTRRGYEVADAEVVLHYLELSTAGKHRVADELEDPGITFWLPGRLSMSGELTKERHGKASSAVRKAFPDGYHLEVLSVTSGQGRVAIGWSPCNSAHRADR
jgi:hypothetical protein